MGHAFLCRTSIPVRIFRTQEAPWFTPSEEGLEPFRQELSDFEITSKGILKIPYKTPLPEELIRRIAELRLEAVSKRQDDSFW